MPIAVNSLSASLALFGLPGHYEAIIVILAILLLFGGRKIPELARGLGRGLRLFKEEISGVKKDLTDTEGPPEDKQLPSDEKKDEDSSDDA